MPFKIDRIDHVVVNCRDLEATAAWYERALGMTRQSFAGGRIALAFGRQKLNLRPTGAESWETGRIDALGSLDICFITEADPEAVMAHLKTVGVAVTEGPVAKTGALGPMSSVYCRDPDGNLVEIASYPR
ncbi:MAG: VOC family protein [Alphaproteobacteria bacterium]|nr:VOC family protein [Alphaproteobacteria bacterium]